MNSKIIAPGVKLCTHKTQQFKTSVVSFNIITNLGENPGKKALLLNLLARTSKAYPSITNMNRRLAELYGAVISPSVRKIGEAQVLSLVLICLDDRFALNKEKVLEEGLWGAFTGGLSATSGGMTVALMVGIVSSLIFKSKMKD